MPATGSTPASIDITGSNMNVSIGSSTWDAAHQRGLCNTSGSFREHSDASASPSPRAQTARGGVMGSEAQRQDAPTKVPRYSTYVPSINSVPNFVLTSGLPHEYAAIVTMVGTALPCATEYIVDYVHCPNCGWEARVIRGSCGRIECPVCFNVWRRRASDRISERIWGYRKFSKYPPWHAVIRFGRPEHFDWNTVVKNLHRIGVLGAMVVMHWYHVRKEFASVIDRERDPEENKYDYIRRTGHWEYLEYDPHVHMIGYGFLAPVRREIKEFQYRKIRSLYSKEDVSRTVYYILGHAGGRPTVRKPSPRSLRWEGFKRSQPDLPTVYAVDRYDYRGIAVSGQRIVYSYIGCVSPRKLAPSYQHEIRVALRCPRCEISPVMLHSDGSPCYITKLFTFGWYRIGVDEPQKCHETELGVQTCIADALNYAGGM